MKSNKMAAVLVTVLILAIGLIGCSNHPQTLPAGNLPAENTVTDELGREVTIPENPQRVLALTSAAMQALLNVGIMPIGKVDEYKISEEGVSLPSVGAPSSVNMESIHALQPDLIIASSRYHAAIEEELESTGAVVYYFDPDKVGDIPVVDVTAYFGRLLDREGFAEQYVQSVHALADQLKERVVSETDIRTGVIIQDGDTIVAAQNASSYGSMLTLLGIENIVPDNLPNATKSSLVPFDIETILASDPDIVLIIASSNNADDNKAILDRFRRDPQWAALKAVKNKRLLILPFSVNPNRSTPDDMVRTIAEVILKTDSQP